MELGVRTQVMGVINMSPDSFSRDGWDIAVDDLGTLTAMASAMVEHGADILDVGGQSTRPGAAMVDAKEEIARVVPVIRALTRSLNVPVSVDSFKPDVVAAALDAGASIVNNVMGTPPDEELLGRLKNSDAGLILMHIRGTPETMQKDIHYEDVVSDVQSALAKSLERCLACGIAAERLMIDPGIGFGKEVDHNLSLIRHLPDLGHLNHPILIGVSRKSFIGRTLDLDVDERIFGSLAAASAAVLNGAHVVRVHDVAATRQTVDMCDAILNAL